MNAKLQSFAEIILMVAASVLVIHNHSLTDRKIDPVVCLPLIVIFSLYFIIHLMKNPSFVGLAHRIGAWIFWLGIFALLVITYMFQSSLGSDEYLFPALSCMAIAMFGLYLRESVSILQKLTNRTLPSSESSETLDR